MAKDADAGKLDFLFEEAEAERGAGQLHDWPPSEKRGWIGDMFG